MAYSALAEARRRCTGTRKDGEPCRAWALWDDPLQRCMNHAGYTHYGPQARRYGDQSAAGKTRYTPCTCAAYNWPHRPGRGGVSLARGARVSVDDAGGPTRDVSVGGAAQVVRPRVLLVGNGHTRNAGTLCYLLCTLATAGLRPRGRDGRSRCRGLRLSACLLTIMLWTSLPPVPTLGVQAPMSACTG